MKKLILSLVFIFSATSVGYQGENDLIIDISGFGAKSPEIMQFLIDRYGTLAMSLKLKMQQEAAIIERVLEENPAITDELNRNTEESILACQELAHRLGKDWFTSDEWVTHVQVIKNETLKQLPQLLSIYLHKTSIIQSDLKKIRGIISDLKNPSEKIRNLSNACVENIQKNDGKLEDINLHNQLAELKDGNDLLTCLVYIFDGLMNQEGYIQRKFNRSEPEKAEALVREIIPFARETVRDIACLVEQALDAKLQKA